VNRLEFDVNVGLVVDMEVAEGLVVLVAAAPNRWAVNVVGIRLMAIGVKFWPRSGVQANTDIGISS
jgi:hypothetical protein